MKRITAPDCSDIRGVNISNGSLDPWRDWPATCAGLIRLILVGSMTETLSMTGRYEILGELGRGARGVVYQARDSRIGRLVALKTIRPETGLTEAEELEFFERFHREALTAGNLTHPNIVTIYDISEDPVKKISFISMEFLEGASLRQMLDEGRIFTPYEAITMVQQVADGLGFAHRKGIIHRDIKPANLILNPDGRVIITDFSVARIASSDLTRSGQFMGTPFYVAPEQIAGGQVDNRSDIFSLAVVLYQLLTNERPFNGDNVSTVLYKIVHREPPPPSQLNVGVPPDMDLVVAKGMAKNPAERYQDAAEMLEDLQCLLEERAPVHTITNPQADLVQVEDEETREETAVTDQPPPQANTTSLNTLNPMGTLVALSSAADGMLTTIRVPSAKTLLIIMAAVVTLALIIVSSILGHSKLNTPQPQLTASAEVTEPLITSIRRPADIWFDSPWSAATVVHGPSADLLDESWQGLMAELTAGEEAAAAAAAAVAERRNNRAPRPLTRNNDVVQPPGFPNETAEVTTAAQTENPEPEVAEVAEVETVTAPAEEFGFLDVTLHHSFPEGRINLLADGEEVFSALLTAEEEPSGKVKGTFDRLKRKIKKSVNHFPRIAVPTGDYTVKIILEIPDRIPARVYLDASLAAAEDKCITVNCGRLKGKKITAQWGCAE